MIGGSVVLANLLYMVMTLGFMLMHGSMKSELLYVDKVAGVSMGSVVARGPIDKLKLPANFVSSSPMNNYE